MNKKVILVGNGINRISNNHSWDDLINNLISFIGAEGQINKRNKPFPLLYEEIVIEAMKNRGIEEMEVKKFIAKEIVKLNQNNIHRTLANVNIENILTTNYDFTIENSIKSSIDIKDKGIIKQTTYSLFRHTENNNKKVWHIHGDANVSSSIMLGYEQYSGYLQTLREYVLGRKLFKSYSPPSIRRKFYDDSFEYDSWLEFFFTHDIHIMGLTLDFVEMHLWWLLTYRARRKQKILPITNKIFFYYNTESHNEINHRLELLKSCDVVPFGIRSNNDFEKFYLRVLKKIAP